MPTPPLPPGRIDMHSHLLPGIDDGCQTLEESLTCVRALLAAGFVGTVCTPHIWPGELPDNTPANIARWAEELRGELARAGLTYHLWTGGELRLFDGVTDWMNANDPPTLAESRCVLVDMWEGKWPKWATPAFRWLLEHKYQPILGHPERMSGSDLDARLRELQAMGVWLQGNLRCLTGEDGYQADQLVRQLLTQGRYRLMALDMHEPASLSGRLDGMWLLESEYGAETLDRLTIEAPRKLVLGLPA